MAISVRALLTAHVTDEMVLLIAATPQLGCVGRATTRKLGPVCAQQLRQREDDALIGWACHRDRSSHRM